MTPSAETKSVAEVLEAAADRLSKPGALIFGPPDNQPFAKDARGVGVRFDDPKAVCWCLLGGINAAAGGRSQTAIDAKKALRQHVGNDGLAAWNHMPGRTKRQVIAKLRQAAALAQEPRDAL